MEVQHDATNAGTQQPEVATKAKAPSGPGVQALQAVLRGGNAAVDHVVMLMREHRAERDDMLTLLHQTLGNSFVSQVLAQVGTTPKDAEATKHHDEAPKSEQLKNAPLGEADRARMRGDVVNENLAHSLAYKNAAELDDADRKFLDEQGLQVGKVIHGVGGLDMTTFIPQPGKTATPVLAFRGTQSGADFIADTNPAGVGAYQMSANEGLIAQTLASLASYGPPTVTGHSLGGSLAQMTASRFPGQVGRVVTFQSPGIPKAMVDKLDAHNKDAEAKGQRPVESTHYAVDGDVIPMAGQAFTAGFMYVIDRGPATSIMQVPEWKAALADHGSHPLEEFVKSGEGQGKRDPSAQGDDKTPTSAHETTPGERRTAFGDKKQHYIEAFRKGIGHVLEAAATIGMGTPTQAYIHVWDEVRAALDRNAKPDQIVALIQASKVRPVDKQMMIDNLNKIEATR